MATLKHKKLQEDAFRKMLEESILQIMKQLNSIDKRLAKLEAAKPKPKGGRNV